MIEALQFLAGSTIYGVVTFYWGLSPWVFGPGLVKSLLGVSLQFQFWWALFPCCGGFLLSGSKVNHCTSFKMRPARKVGLGPGPAERDAVKNVKL